MSENTPETPAPRRRRRSDVYYEAQPIPPQTPSALKKKPAEKKPGQNTRERNTQPHTVLRDAPVFPTKPPPKKEKDWTPAVTNGPKTRGETSTRKRLNTKPVPVMRQGTGAITGIQPAMPSKQTPAYTGQQPMNSRQMPAYTGQQAPMNSRQMPAYTGQQTPMNSRQQPRYQTYQGDRGVGRSGYIPPVPPSVPPAIPPKPPAGGRKPGKKPRKGHSVISYVLIRLIAAAVVVALGVVIVNTVRQQQARDSFEAAVHAYDARYCEGVYVDGIHLGGMSQAEAADIIIRHAQQENGSWSVRLTYGGETLREITASDLNITIDVNDALAAAWSQGHTGTIDERSAAMDQLRVSPFQTYTAIPSKDTSSIDTILTDLRSRFYKVPQDAYLVSFTPGATDPFVVQEEVPGTTLDIEPLRAQLYEMVSTMTSGEIVLQPQPIKADITTMDVRNTLTLRGSATTEISTTSTDNRNNNIRRAFELITGTILAPGKSFSFNDIVGERSVANGFYEAPEIVYGELTTGIGGGVCQASTTVYQAAVRAGLVINDRTPHSEKANYSDYGLDATVYWNGKRRIDLKFTNNTDGNIYIVSSVQSNPSNRKRLITKVDIYGMSMGNVQYDLANELVEELPYKSETRRDKDRKYEDKILYSDEKLVVQEGRDGYIYKSYRVTLVDGKETERTLLAKDEYKARNEIIYVGTVNR